MTLQVPGVWLKGVVTLIIFSPGVEKVKTVPVVVGSPTTVLPGEVNR